MISFLGGFLAWHFVSFGAGIGVGMTVVQVIDNRIWKRQAAGEAERDAKLAEGRANQARDQVSV